MRACTAQGGLRGAQASVGYIERHFDAPFWQYAVNRRRGIEPRQSQVSQLNNIDTIVQYSMLYFSLNNSISFSHCKACNSLYLFSNPTRTEPMTQADAYIANILKKMTTGLRRADANVLSYVMMT